VKRETTERVCVCVERGQREIPERERPETREREETRETRERLAARERETNEILYTESQRESNEETKRDQPLPSPDSHPVSLTLSTHTHTPVGLWWVILPASMERATRESISLSLGGISAQCLHTAARSLKGVLSHPLPSFSIHLVIARPVVLPTKSVS